MKATISTYGGDITHGVQTVQHWVLHVDGWFVKDVSSLHHLKMLQLMADAINLVSEPIRIPCEGSERPTLWMEIPEMFMCSMCGEFVSTDDLGRARPHQRNDTLNA